jgi:hypothetical protein
MIFTVKFFHIRYKQPTAYAGGHDYDKILTRSVRFTLHTCNGHPASYVDKIALPRLGKRLP